MSNDQICTDPEVGISTKRIAFSKGHTSCCSGGEIANVLIMPGSYADIL